MLFSFSTPSVFLSILTIFCQISLVISLKSVSVGLFTPSVFLPFLLSQWQQLLFSWIGGHFTVP